MEEIINNLKEENDTNSEKSDLLNQNYWQKVKGNFMNLKKEISLKDILGKSYPFFESMKKYHKVEYTNFMAILPNLITLLLEGKENNFNKIKILHTDEKNSKNKLSRKQVAYIFTLAFFNISLPVEKKNLNSFNFNFILNSNKHSTIFEFGRCFLNYLTNIGNLIKENNIEILSEEVSFIRNCIDEYQIINEDIPLCEIEIKEGSMYDSNASYIVDFANKYIGGGTLHGGSVQEEILFAIQPELSCSMAFMEMMSKNDAIRIDNTILYSNYKGYSSSFSFAENGYNNKKRYRILAMDSVVGSLQQFKLDNILRDLHKAYVCFNLINYDENDKIEKSIATGNWGCGVFGGDHELKFIQQWIAASFAKVEKLDYYSFNCKEMANITQKFHELKTEYKTANNLYRAIMGNQKELKRKKVLESLLREDVINSSKDGAIEVMI